MLKGQDQQEYSSIAVSLAHNAVIIIQRRDEDRCVKRELVGKEMVTCAASATADPLLRLPDIRDQEAGRDIRYGVQYLITEFLKASSSK